MLPPAVCTFDHNFLSLYIEEVIVKIDVVHRGKVHSAVSACQVLRLPADSLCDSAEPGEQLVHGVATRVREEFPLIGANPFKARLHRLPDAHIVVQPADRLDLVRLRGLHHIKLAEEDVSQVDTDGRHVACGLGVRELTGFPLLIAKKATCRASSLSCSESSF